MKIEKHGSFFKVDEAAQIAYGWAIVCTENGEEYTDLQGDHIPEDVMVKAAIDFAANSRVGKDMHQGERVGSHLFTYPVTKASADLGLTSTKTGLLVGFKPDDPALLDLIKQGKRSGFSIGGVLLESDDGVGKSIEKAADGEAQKPRRVFREFRINEISLVDVPAMEGAVVGYVKAAPIVIAERSDGVSTVVVQSDPLEVIAALLDEKLASAPTRRAIAQSKSTRSWRVNDGVSTNMSIEDATAEIETLKAKLADAEKLLALTPEERAAEIEKSDPVAYRGEASGITVRKSEATSFSLALAKAHEAQAVALAKQKADLAKQAEEIEKADVRKCASETLGALTGGDDLHDLIVRSVKKSGAPVEKIGEALEAMKGWNALAAKAGVAKGENPGSDPQPVTADEALAALTKGLETFAKSKNITKVWTEGLAAFTKTEEGAALKRAYDESRNA